MTVVLYLLYLNINSDIPSTLSYSELLMSVTQLHIKATCEHYNSMAFCSDAETMLVTYVTAYSMGSLFIMILE